MSDIHVGVVVHTHRGIAGLYSPDPHFVFDVRADHSRWLCIAVNNDNDTYAFIWLEDLKTTDPNHPTPTPKRGWLTADYLEGRMKSDNIRIEESA